MTWLTNDFHNTRTFIRPRDGAVSHAAGARAWKALCGQHGCMCGGILGQRGAQYDDNGRRLVIEQIEYGTRAATVRVQP